MVVTFAKEKLEVGVEPADQNLGMGVGEDDPNKPEEKGEVTAVQVVVELEETPKMLLVPKVEVQPNKFVVIGEWDPKPKPDPLPPKPKVGDGVENGVEEEEDANENGD